LGISYKNINASLATKMIMFTIVTMDDRFTFLYS
jgi:hypothetical protein